MYRELFNSSHASVYDGRWGSVLHATSSVLLLEEAFKNGVWSRDRFLAGGDVAENNGDGSLQLDAVSEGVASKLFWGYCHMVDSISEVMEKLVVWADGVPMSSRT